MVQMRQQVQICKERGRGSELRWPPELPQQVQLPPDCNAGDLIEVLEMLLVGHPCLAPCSSCPKENISKVKAHVLIGLLDA